MRFFYQNREINILQPPKLLEEESWFQNIVDTYTCWQRDDYIEIETSGSTGTPKVIRHSKRSISRSAELTIERFGLGVGTKAWLCLPARYIAGKMMIIRAIIGDWDLHISAPKADPFVGLGGPMDFAALTPMQLSRGLSSNPDGVRSIGSIILGGGPVGASLAEQITGLVRPRVYHTYGMTETITHIAVRELNGPHAKECYQALPGVSLGVDDEQCLVIRAEHIEPPVLVTRDIVELRSLTEFVWLGRADHMINSGGVKVNPVLIEETIGEINSDVDYFITSKPDDELGDRIVLVTDASVRCFREISAQMDLIEDRKIRPKEIVFVERILRTPTNKIIRNLSRYKCIVANKRC